MGFLSHVSVCVWSSVGLQFSNGEELVGLHYHFVTTAVHSTARHDQPLTQWKTLTDVKIICPNCVCAANNDKCMQMFC